MTSPLRAVVAAVYAALGAYGSTQFALPAMFHPASDGSGEWVMSSSRFTARIRGHSVEVSSAACRIQFDHHNSRHVAPQPLRPLSAHLSYVSGTGVRALNGFEELLWKDAYSGIDAVYSAGAAHLKSTFIVHPGADPKQIRIRVSGHRTLALDHRGNLAVRTDKCSFEDPTGGVSKRGWHASARTCRIPDRR